ncbi:GntR family transcriptional regulator [Proteiniclasticum ruminis]|uniref:DNA-binding transcriptional regulator, GntR family n=1 Tax=Proteiniclasticum ruminis TaxID=398199 RepID=A0A1I5BT72_9CLOT|nr:GntR family transcriptional regulator [Proteiniclasticum ruminis]SFN77561.1 DNA-binding transcriptional regulator, GntR family [Proteiniclasticum ruminis]
MEITARKSKETARDYAFRTLRKNIVNLKLQPGSMVSEKELADEMGISRTPTREALIELSKSQIVDILPQKGSYISKIDYSLVDEARFMRLVLENAVVETVCEVATEEDHRILLQNISMQEIYLNSSSFRQFFQLDNEFHEQLFIIARKTQIYHLMDSMMIHFDRVRMLRLLTDKEVQELLDDHRAILDAIMRKSKIEAVALMTSHLSRYKVDEELIRRDHPDYFV